MPGGQAPFTSGTNSGDHVRQICQDVRAGVDRIEQEELDAGSYPQRGRVALDLARDCGGLCPVPVIDESVARAVRRVTDAELRALVGATSLQRGRSYVAQHRVGTVSMPGPNLLAATVRGQGRTYSTQ